MNVSEVAYDVEDINGIFWMVGNDRMWSLSADRRVMTEYAAKSIETNELLSQNLWSVYADRWGLVWLGKAVDKAPYFDTKRTQFEFYSIENEESGEQGYISDIHQDEEGRLWCATDGTPLLYDLEKQQFQPLLSAAFQQKTARAVFPDDKDWLVFCMKPELVRYNKTTGEAFSYSLLIDGKALQYDATAIAFDQDGDIWISTWQQGLFYIKKSVWETDLNGTSNFEQWTLDLSIPNTVPTNELSFVMTDSRNQIWVSGNYGGLTRIDKKTMTFQQFDFQQNVNSISDTYVYETLEDKEGNIWIATKKGALNKFNPETEQFMHYNGKHGLQSDHLRSLEQDKEGHIWLNTFTGISSFNPKTEQFTNYNREDGLLSWRWALEHNPQFNTLIFGGEGGFHTVDIDNLKNQPTESASLVLTQINVFSPTSKKILPRQPIEWKNNQLELSYKENILNLQFAVLDFRNASKHEFQYALTQGEEPEWIDIGGQNQVNLNQLEPGNYFFHLKGCNSDKVWATLEQPLAITIHPPFWASWWAYLFYFIVGMVGLYYFYTFTLSRQLAEQKAKQLKNMDQLKTRFYTNITHEFRTPLTVILGLISQLKTGKWLTYIHSKEKNNIQTNLQLIERNGKKLLSLINQLLDLSKLDTNNLKPNYQPIEIVSFIQYVGESFESLAETNNVRLSIYSEINELIMETDEDKLQKILSNLLSNAIKFTPERGKVVLHIAKKEKSLHIKVRDTGEGIPQKSLPHIFDRFYQVDNQLSKQGEGTGIGLALVKELVELMEGNISVTSQERQGTEFLVVLPIRISEKPLEAKEEIQKSSLEVAGKALVIEKAIENFSSPSIPFHNNLPHLLIVEDNPDVIFYIQSVLSIHYQVIIAKNGQLGIDKAIETIPDLIISDVMMPKKNGFELVETLKSDERTNHIPIILLTAKATQQDKLAGLKYGADAYLMKPFDKEELLIRLEKLLEMRKALQQRYSQEVSRKLSGEELSPLSPEDIFLKKLNTLLEKHYEDAELNIKDLAKMLHLSHQQFYRKLKALTNQTPIRYLRTFRLNKAKALLLADNNLNVSEVAYDVGFDSPNYFSRVFLEEFGVSPNKVHR